MLNRIKMAGVFVLVSLMFFGCGSNPVALVQNGVMNSYDSTTIQLAFEASFDNPKWESFETKKGQTVVEFTGTISQDLHDAVIKEIGVDLDDVWAVGTPVEVQWLISTDGQTFDISHMGSEAWEGVKLSAILDMIYS